MKRRKQILVLVNGEPSSAMGHRARALTAFSNEAFEFHLRYRTANKVRSLQDFLAALRHLRPALTYVFDMAASGVLAAGLNRIWRRGKLIVDTGDAIADLARAMGRGRIGSRLTDLLERFSFGVADHVVVRGSCHRELLTERGIASTFIPDGVETDLFRPPDRPIDNDGITVGLVGSTIWNPKTRSCYGSELLDILHAMRDESVRGILVGDGSGLPYLRDRARELGIADRIEFAGRLAYHRLPDQIARFDVALSTQTNDLPGRVRTTGKLPLYLACDRFVLASRVGEASRILPSEMLVEYEGANDPSYSSKLVERLRRTMREPGRFRVSGQTRRLAEEHFAYPMLAQRFAACIETVLGS